MRVLAILLIFANLLLNAACEATYSPSLLPVRFVVSSDGTVTIEGDVARFVTPIGVFAIGGAVPVVSSSSDLIVTLRNRQTGTDSVFRVSARDSLSVTIDGATQLQVESRRVTVEVLSGSVRELLVRPLPREQLLSGRSPVAADVPDQQQPTESSAPSAEFLVERRSVTVRSDVPWTDTELTVKAGDKIDVTATGLIKFADPASENTSSPEGSAHRRGGCSYVVTSSGVPAHSLVGNVAAAPSLDGRGFFVGPRWSGTTPVRGTTAEVGRLFLGFNDGAVLCDRSGVDSWGFSGDNSGSFVAEVQIARRR